MKVFSPEGLFISSTLQLLWRSLLYTNIEHATCVDSFENLGNMTIFVEKVLIQLSVQGLEELACHPKLNYTAVISNQQFGEVFFFEEVCMHLWLHPPLSIVGITP